MSYTKQEAEAIISRYRFSVSVDTFQFSFKLMAPAKVDAVRRVLVDEDGLISGVTGWPDDDETRSRIRRGEGVDHFLCTVQDVKKWTERFIFEFMNKINRSRYKLAVESPKIERVDIAFDGTPKGIDIKRGYDPKLVTHEARLPLLNLMKCCLIDTRGYRWRPSDKDNPEFGLSTFYLGHKGRNEYRLYDKVHDDFRGKKEKNYELSPPQRCARLEIAICEPQTLEELGLIRVGDLFKPCNRRLSKFFRFKCKDGKLSKLNKRAYDRLRAFFKGRT